MGHWEFWPETIISHSEGRIFPAHRVHLWIGREHGISFGILVTHWHDDMTINKTDNSQATFSVFFWRWAIKLLVHTGR